MFLLFKQNVLWYEKMVLLPVKFDTSFVCHCLRGAAWGPLPANFMPLPFQTARERKGDRGHRNATPHPLSPFFSLALGKKVT
jgi:hypothetical protein